MPRLARLDVPGVLQHIIARGIDGKEIFKDDVDRESFVSRLGKVVVATKTQCFAWVLIPDHFHLLFRTGSTPLSLVMRRLLTGHAVYFNKRHGRNGYLFQNRYKSIVCDDAYLLELVRYIHLNPLREGLVKNVALLDRYPWSGHSYLMGRRKNDWQVVNEVLLLLSDESGKAVRRYRRFMEEGIERTERLNLERGGRIQDLGEGGNGYSPKEKETGISDGRVLGATEFVERVLENSHTKVVKRKSRIPLSELIGNVTGFLGMEKRDLLAGRRKKEVTSARALVSYLAVEEMGYRFSEIGLALNIHPVNVARSLERGKEVFDKYKEVWGKAI